MRSFSYHVLVTLVLFAAMALSVFESVQTVSAEFVNPFVSAPKPQRNKDSTSSGGARGKVYYPVHPRVNINFTQGHVNSNITREELRAIEKSKLVLTKLIVINRHGHRAPNAPYWRYCPNDHANKRKYSNYYDTDPEDLSGLGMREEFQLGSHIRRVYDEFLGRDRRFNKSHHYFRAVGEPRILQSASAVAEGVFPQGFGQDHFLPWRPQFVPIFSDMDTHEYLLDDVPCFARAEADVAAWQRDSWPAYAAHPRVRKVIADMEEVCGVRVEELLPEAERQAVREREDKGLSAVTADGTKVVKAKPFAFVKTVADGMTFNSDLGLTLCKGYYKGKRSRTVKIDSEFLYNVRNLSYDLLMQRLYTTDEQQTYTVVDLPLTILKLFNHTHLADVDQVKDYRDTRQETSFFFVHRESLYALAQFFGFKYAVKGLPPGEVPVAATLLLEKLMPKRAQEEHEDDSDSRHIYVRLKLWVPSKGHAQPLDADFVDDGVVTTVTIPACRMPELCELRELRQMYEARVARTGTWEKICNYNPQELDHTTDIR